MNTIAQITESLDMQLRDALANDPLAALAAITTIHAVVAERERAAVMAALPEHTWREIGVALGVSKQAAFQRFGKEWRTASKAQMSKPDWKQVVRRTLA